MRNASAVHRAQEQAGSRGAAGQAGPTKGSIAPRGAAGSNLAPAGRVVVAVRLTGRRAAGILVNPSKTEGRLLVGRQGMSILQGKENIFSDCKKKFWNTYKTGLLYWPFVQLSNFVLVPVYLRTAYTGLCGFLWAIFICFSQQSGDGTAKSAFLWFQREKVNADGEPSEK
nr:mpv17-like protein isoform X6 [Chrysemys picta bellii]